MIRVSKKNPCPVCGKPDWCMISPDGQSAICARVSSDKPVGNRGAGWLHRLGQNVAIPQRPESPKRCDITKAPPDILDQTYRHLLSALGLSEPHRNSLLRRGLTDDQIKALQYRSMPQADRNPVVRQILQKTILQGVPGFWKNSHGQWHLSGPHGIMIPVRDVNGRISGIQIRCEGSSQHKYIWLSSADRPSGTGAGTSVHVAVPQPHLMDEVWVTEGPLKADIAALKLRRIVLAIPGVSCWAQAIPVLNTLRIKKVVVALDMDKLNNHYVGIYRSQLINRLLRTGFAVYEADWDRQYKGIDDILVTGDLNE